MYEEENRSINGKNAHMLEVIESLTKLISEKDDIIRQQKSEIDQSLSYKGSSSIVFENSEREEKSTPTPRRRQS